MGIVLTGGTVVTAEGSYQAEVRIEGELIAAIGENLAQAGDRILDVRNCLLLPGGIDPHTHFDLPVGQTTTADDFASGTAAALLGGTTTIIDFATQNKGETLSQALNNWMGKAGGKAYTDYGFHMAITDWTPTTSEEMEQMLAAGVSSFKLYLAYKGALQVGDEVIFRALRHSKMIGALIGFHCENGDVIDVLVKEALSKGLTAPRYHALTRPEAAEREAVERIIALTEMAEAQAYIVHLSTEQGLQSITRAQDRGVEIYAETCPQYLLLDDSAYESAHNSAHDSSADPAGHDEFAGAKYVMSPPLRKPKDQDALWEGLAEGTISTVATDHCSFNYKGQKELGRGDFSKIPNGAPGVEHRLSLLYTYGVLTGKISLEQFAALTSTNAARLFGLFPRKGQIAVGSDADLVVWNPLTDQVITAQQQKQRVDYTPYEGMQVKGRAEHVFLRGRQVVVSGKLSTEEPSGHYLPREKFQGFPAVP